MHDRLQAREISVVRVSLYEARIGPLVHIAQCRNLRSRLVGWRQLEPSPIYRGGLAEQMPFGEKIADATIDECRSRRIGDIAQCIRSIFRVVRKPRIGWGSNVAGGVVAAQRVPARPAVSAPSVRCRLSSCPVLAPRPPIRFLRS